MNPFICPACGRSEERVSFVCSKCWWKVPAKDRAQIRAMNLHRQDITTKLEKIVRNLKAKQRETPRIIDLPRSPLPSAD
jgi:predicted amidophosphoribosyltransferase